MTILHAPHAKSVTFLMHSKRLSTSLRHQIVKQTDRFGIEGEEDSDKGDGEVEADEPEWEQSRAMFQISNAEADGIDKLTEMDRIRHS